MLRGSIYASFLACVALAISAAPQRLQAQPGGSDDPQVCAKAGGVLQARGKAQYRYCIIPSPDAGKACSNKTDCTGLCLIDPTSETTKAYQVSVERCAKLCGDDKDHKCAMHCLTDPKDAPKLVGRCQPDKGPLFGCFFEIDGGRFGSGMCRD